MQALDIFGDRANAALLLLLSSETAKPKNKQADALFGVKLSHL